MRPRALLLFILLNVLITTGVAFAVISFFGDREAGTQVVQYATVQVIITATRDPNATPDVRIITATPRPGEVNNLPTGVLDEVAGSGTTTGGTEEGSSTTSGNVPQNTVDPALLEGDAALASTVAALPENCILHTLADGENPALLAEQYGTDVNSILVANGLSEEDAAFLQIDQVLVIPLPGCPLEALPTPDTSTDETTDETVDETEEADPDAALTETATLEATQTPTVTATITLPPTAIDAQIEIVEVSSPGDVTTEAVIIRNNGRNVNLTGWTITNLAGEVYTFPERNLFSNGEITLFTGSGQNTAVVMYIGSDTAVWGQPGDVVTLTDANGVVQAAYRIPTALNLP